MATYAVGQRLTAAMLQELSDLIDNTTQSSSVTSDSGTITTTETTVQSLTATLVLGQTYRVIGFMRASSSVAGDIAIARLRLTSSAGTEIAATQQYIGSTSTVGFGIYFEAEYTPGASGSQVFVMTLTRNGGSGNLIARAGSTAPNLLTCRLKG